MAPAVVLPGNPLSMVRVFQINNASHPKSCATVNAFVIQRIWQRFRPPTAARWKVPARPLIRRVSEAACAKLVIFVSAVVTNGGAQVARGLLKRVVADLLTPRCRRTRSLPVRQTKGCSLRARELSRVCRKVRQTLENRALLRRRKPKPSRTDRKRKQRKPRHVIRRRMPLRRPPRPRRQLVRPAEHLPEQRGPRPRIVVKVRLKVLTGQVAMAAAATVTVIQPSISAVVRRPMAYIRLKTKRFPVSLIPSATVLSLHKSAVP